MNFYLVKTPKIVSTLYKNYLWKINTNKKEIYLTFDDGPTPVVTEFVLETLKKHHAKATFFCVGKNIEKHPKLFNKIIEEGHAVGNHTFKHLNGWKTNVKSYTQNVEKAQKTIDDYKNPQTYLISETLPQKFKLQTLFRPPYGKIKKSQAKQLINKGYKIIMWSVLSGDFDVNIHAKTCLDNVVKNTEKGSIIVFHDSEKAYEKLKKTLPKIITHFLKLGYDFKAIKCFV
ncbi:MAG: polysaccharide deacetylase family protein [Flavobacteriaceae bacterium]|nr:polysaccharide deacetylase family protein [Flavobacteriaceae bacterium]